MKGEKIIHVECILMSKSCMKGALIVKAPTGFTSSFLSSQQSCEGGAIEMSLMAKGEYNLTILQFITVTHWTLSNYMIFNSQNTLPDLKSIHLNTSGW